MSEVTHFKFSNRVLLLPLLLVLTIWTVYFLELKFRVNLIRVKRNRFVPLDPRIAQPFVQ